MSIKVIRGNPTPEELAAALAVVRARAIAAQSQQPRLPAPRDTWSDPSRVATRQVPHPGPTSWPRTYWPT
ncbi:acyl-CoA carboxylase subunit epsilon [Streptomyces sp. NPDC059477]|uniref:acyl-CoA carboxylase subunit epsilon n=1 Tax=unclassified Streptomyces TaxID=2593676 RepID=UPI003688BA06